MTAFRDVRVNDRFTIIGNEAETTYRKKTRSTASREVGTGVHRFRADLPVEAIDYPGSERFSGIPGVVVVKRAAPKSSK